MWFAFGCKNCSKTICWEESLQHHTSCKHKSTTLICDYCGKTICREDSLQTHQLSRQRKEKANVYVAVTLLGCPAAGRGCGEGAAAGLALGPHPPRHGALHGQPGRPHRHFHRHFTVPPNPRDIFIPFSLVNIVTNTAGYIEIKDIKWPIKL